MKTTAKRNLSAILNAHCAQNVAELARNLYKYTDCGAWLGVEVKGKWHYDIELRNIKDQNVSALKVGSIVEGTDTECDIHVLELAGFATGQAALSAYDEAVQAIETEAQEIWNDTHGCEQCAQHWQLEGIEELAEWGDVPVWSECPECDGHGISK